jgi:hypothetical protein
MTKREAMRARRKADRSMVCCDEFWMACQSGTDGEGYGPLISTWSHVEPIEFRLASCLPDPEFCPWCGGSWPPIPLPHPPQPQDGQDG